MIQKGLNLLIVFLLLAFNACREPFDIELDAADLSLLVVEGYVEVEGKESMITLSRTLPLGSEASLAPEENARVFLESNSGQIWNFEEVSPGRYSFGEALDINQQYSLKIRLSNNREYASGYMEANASPEIDEIGFDRDEDGISLFVSTQGSAEAAYYIWDFEETWNFRSAVTSSFLYDAERDMVLPRTVEQRTDLCWKGSPSRGIIMESSKRFANDFIFRKEIHRIPLLSEKLGRRYSILVRQRVVDREAFDFWEIMKKNSDDLSGIFSPLPSLMTSNISNVDDPSENVIGHISLGASREKRIFISNSEVSPWRIFIDDYENCRYSSDTIPPSLYRGAFGGKNIVPVQEITEGLAVLGYTGGSRACTDCTLRGSKEKPEFWVDDF